MRNNFKIASRYLWRNKTSSVLNIAGLSLGITSALILFLFIRDQLSYDTFHTKGDRIYRVGMDVTRDGNPSPGGSTSLALGKVLEEEFPQIEKAAIVFYLGGSTYIVDPDKNESGIKKFRQEEFGTAYVAPSFYEMFDFKWVIGDYKKVLIEPNSAAISKDFAEKFFGVKNGAYQSVIGHTLKLNNQITLTVNGVIDNPPKNTDFPFEVVISQATHYNQNKDEYSNWWSIYSATNNYVMLKPGFSPKDLEAQLARVAKERPPANPGATLKFFLQPLNDLHFNGELGNYSFKTINKNTLFALGLIAAFLILTACVNFINLSTAQAVKRAKEVGIKKTLGAGNASLFTYFMGEIALIVFFSMALSIAIAELITPFISERLSLNIEYNSFTDFQAFGFLLVLSAATILIAGSYPSFLMSKAAPIKAMRGGLSGGGNKSGLFLRRSLVVFQFVLSQALIIGVLVITGQIEFFKTKDLGFDKDLVLLAPIPEGGLAKRDYLYNSIKNLPEVKEVSFSFNPPSSIGGTYNTIILPENAQDNGIQVELKPIDDRFIGMYKLQLLAGRDFMPADSSDHIIINESLMRKAGIKNPEDALGFNFYRGIKTKRRVEVIGVLKDFYLASLHAEIHPMMMLRIPDQSKDDFGFLANIKLKAFTSTASVQSAMKGVQKVWESSFPSEIYEARFLDESLYDYYSDEERMSNIIKFFTLIAVLIGCIGLYGLISFVAAQKTKEIGVRKVLGASTSGIVALLSKEFLILMGISFLISWPLSYYYMDKWLADYPNRIHIGFGIFALAALLAFAVSMATISYQAVKAATANPVKSLKYE